MIKAVILARVSTKRQEMEGLSLKEIQLPFLQKYAIEKEFDVVREFVYSETADYKIRKKFNEVIEFVKTNTDVKVILCFRVDRATRNYRDAVLIDDLRLEYDKEIHFVYDHLVINKKSVGRDIQDWDLKVFLAKQTINRLKEDAITSASYMLHNGLWPVNAPFGYRNITKEDKKKWIIIEPIEAEIVKKIYEWYSTGAFSMLEIKYKLKEVFIRDFSKGMVDKILKNSFYHGIMVYSGQKYPHKYECIISMELYDKVQQIKAGYNKKHFKFAGLPYQYRGLIRCNDCGCMITPEKHKGHIYYHCTQYKGKHNAKWLREEEITNQFSNLFKKIQIPTEVLGDITNTLRQSHKDKSYFVNNLLEEHQKGYKKYEERIEKMYEDKLDGSITEDYYNNKREEYRAKQHELQGKMAKLTTADEDYYITADYLLQLSNRAYELFQSSEVQEKRQLLKLILQNLRLNGSSVDYDLIKPFDKIFFYASRQQWLPRLDSNQ